MRIDEKDQLYSHILRDRVINHPYDESTGTKSG